MTPGDSGNAKQRERIVNPSQIRRIGVSIAGLAHIIGVMIVVFVPQTSRTLFRAYFSGSISRNVTEVYCGQGVVKADMNATLALIFLLLPGILIFWIIATGVPAISIPSLPAAIGAIAISTTLFSYYGSLISDRRSVIELLILAAIHSVLAIVVFTILGFAIAFGCAG